MDGTNISVAQTRRRCILIVAVCQLCLLYSHTVAAASDSSNDTSSVSRTMWPHATYTRTLRKLEKRNSNNSTKGGCGNGYIDDLEECDPSSTKNKYDPCCSNTCRLQSFASCSPFKDICCTNDCKVAPPGQICKNSTVSQDSNSISCTGNHSVHVLVCDGVNPGACSQEKYFPAAEFSRCDTDSVCTNGTCLRYCNVSELNANMSGLPNWAVCDCSLYSPYWGRQDALCDRCCERGYNVKDLCVAWTRHAEDTRFCVVAMCPERACIRVETNYFVHSSNFTGQVPNNATSWEVVLNVVQWTLPLGLLLVAMCLFYSLGPLCLSNTKKKGNKLGKKENKLEKKKKQLNKIRSRRSRTKMKPTKVTVSVIREVDRLNGTPVDILPAKPKESKTRRKRTYTEKMFIKLAKKLEEHEKHTAEKSNSFAQKMSFLDQRITFKKARLEEHEKHTAGKSNSFAQKMSFLDQKIRFKK